MNLHGIAAGIVSAVNPAMSVQWTTSAGYTTAADGSRTPTIAPPVTLQAQVQALSSEDLKQLDGINLQGEKVAIYCNGSVRGVSLPDRTGGDTFTFPDGSVWLVLVVLENWGRMDGWTKVAAIRQSA